jgi:hypothetical protein
MVMVGDASEDEAERLFFRALPKEFRTKIEQEVEKHNREGKLIIEGLPSTMVESQVMAFLAVETNRQPRSVELLPGGKWKVRCVDEAHRAATMQLDPSPITPGSWPEPTLGQHQLELATTPPIVLGSQLGCVLVSGTDRVMAREGE